MAPRVLSRTGGDPVLLEDEIREALRAGDRVLQICGPAGAGKTRALRHLAAVLEDQPEVLFLDEPARPTAHDPRPVVCAARRPVRGAPAYTLAPWTQDDLIEYLLARHRDACGEVLERFYAAGDAGLLEGRPELCRAVLDHLVTHPELGGVRAALRDLIRTTAESESVLRRVRLRCRDLLLRPGTPWSVVERWLRRSPVGDEGARILRHAAVQIVVSAEAVIRDLMRSRGPRWVEQRVPVEILREAGVTLAADPDALGEMGRAFRRAGPNVAPFVATVLHCSDPNWRPSPSTHLHLAYSVLAEAPWAELDLRGSDLTGAILNGADLRRSDLRDARIVRTRLHGAALGGADLRDVYGRHVHLAGADLTGARLTGGVFARAVADGANFKGADLCDTRWKQASIVDADLVGANLSGADLQDADVRRSDFSGADFTRASLEGVDLRESLLLGACFKNADLARANLECMILPDMDFSGADLHRVQCTGSVFPGAKMRGAHLTHAELADVHWEGADLRDADLRGAMFHAGTIRDGVPAGAPSPEWEHPPIYPDDTSSLEYLPPDVVRKANLRGADLRGAEIHGVNFLLVDLRDAKLDPEQRRLARATGAILEYPPAS